MQRRKKWIIPLLACGGLIVAALVPAAVIWLMNSSGREEEKPLVVCLDAGHGGSQPGAERDGRLEKDDTLRMALRVREILQERGVACHMTRSGDTALELDARVDFAEAQNADVLISLHRNSGGGAGLEIWINSQPAPEETRLAGSLQNRLLEASGMNDRGVKRGTPGDPEKNFVINTAGMPSCLIELGFIDSQTDNGLFDTHFDAIAEAIADGIMGA